MIRNTIREALALLGLVMLFAILVPAAWLFGRDKDEPIGWPGKKK